MGSIKREVILAKIESVYNTDPVPVEATDSILVENIQHGLDSLRMVDRPAVRALIGKLQQLYGGSLRMISFDVELKGAAATYSASVYPEAHPILRMCGLSATGDFTGGSETWTYQVISSGFESGTIYYFEDGKRYILTGCRAMSASIKYPTGGVPKLSVSFVGHSVAPTDVALASPTIDTHAPPVAVGATFTVGGVAHVIEALDVDLGLELAKNPSISAADGYGELKIVARDVMGSFNPESVLMATDDLEGALRAGTLKTIVMGPVGATQYNKHTLTLLRAYYRDMSPEDRNSIRTFSIPFGCSNTADDEFVLVFD